MMVNSETEGELFDAGVMGNVLKSGLVLLLCLGCLDSGLIGLEFLLGNFSLLIGLGFGQLRFRMFALAGHHLEKRLLILRQRFSMAKVKVKAISARDKATLRDTNKGN